MEEEMPGYTDKHAVSGIKAKLPAIETWPNQYPGYEITIEAPEFTSVCPKTGLPDFGTLTLKYVPDSSCLELKSFKEYLQSFRSLGIFYENAVNRIMEDVVKACNPVKATLKGTFNPRGGMNASVEVTFTRRETPEKKEEIVLPVESPVGPLDVTIGRKGIRSIAFDGTALPGKPPLEFKDIYKRLVKELREYFAGKRKNFDIPLDPCPGGTDFQERVWTALQEIPFGQVISYSDLADWAGNPKAVRAAASACGANRIPILIPCHRVVSRQGLGGFAGGLEVKKFLLEHESRSS